MLGVYLHVPFCSAICNYCNFNRGLYDADLKERYVNALVDEIRASPELRTPNPEPRTPNPESRTPNPESRIPNPGPRTRAAADTIYFGGGTPSLLEPSEIARIIHACDEVF